MNKIKPRVFPKKPIYILIYLFWTYLLVEAGLWIFLYSYRFHFRFSEAANFTLNDEQISQLREIYDPLLGWKEVNHTPFGERKDDLEDLPVLGSTFGDSFTFGYEVGDQETWQYRLSKRLHGRILNFGVGGYGLDQALLNFEKSDPKIAGKYAFLALIPGDIDRSFNIYRHFLRGQEAGKPLTKPRFELRDGKPSLIDNPIHSAEELSSLKDPDFIHRIESLDWERTQLSSKYPSYGFPRVRVLFNAEFYRQLRGIYRTPPYEMKMELTHQLLLKFKEEACKNGEVPRVILFPDSGLMKNHQAFLLWRSDFLGFCLHSNLLCYFPGDDFYQGNKKETYFAPGGHLNPKGNKLVADQLFARMRQERSTEDQTCK